MHHECPEVALEPIYVFSLAAQHERWATVRQAAISGNIANVNTPGYSALEIEPFSAIMDDTSGVTLARTAPGHLSASGDTGDRGMREWATTETDKRVALDQQLVAADETNRSFSLDTGIVRAFHRMLMTAVRSG